MAFPQIVGTNSSSHDTATTTHTVALPPQILAGDLLFVFFGHTGSFTVPVFPAGWTRTTNSGTYSNFNNIGAVWGWRIADGAEGASISVTTGGTVRSAHYSYRIQGQGYPGLGDVGSWGAAGGDNTAEFQGSITPPGLGDHLFLACVAADSGFVATAMPGGYVDLQTSVSGAVAGPAGSCALSVAWRQLNTASAAAPGPATMSGVEDFMSTVILIPTNNAAKPNIYRPHVVRR